MAYLFCLLIHTINLFQFYSKAAAALDNSLSVDLQLSDPLAEHDASDSSEIDDPEIVLFHKFVSCT